MQKKGGTQVAPKTPASQTGNSEVKLKAALKLKIRVHPSQNKLTTSISMTPSDPVKEVNEQAGISGWENNNEIINISNIGNQ
jgi:hypothetical protein